MIGRSPNAPVGAGLLAKASCQSTSMLNDRPLSRASPLPQGGIAKHLLSYRLSGFVRLIRPI
ncbi:hypothetical protein FE275_05040 [Pseudomonas koreensis]|nr:hypothetical protein FE275_05040 [Pseudomonas koreensis]